VSGKKRKKLKLSPPLAYDELLVDWAARTVTYQGRTFTASQAAVLSIPVLAVRQRVES
jgi:hypothetical protein